MCPPQPRDSLLGRLAGLSAVGLDLLLGRQGSWARDLRGGLGGGVGDRGREAGGVLYASRADAGGHDGPGCEDYRMVAGFEKGGSK